MKDLFADYGGTPNSSSGAAITANNSAIAAALADAVANGADGFYFDQPFWFDQPFSFPVQTASPHRPLHFGIQGKSPSAWMNFTGDTSTVAAISLSGTPFPSEYSGNELVFWLYDFVLNGGSIYIYDCGKYLRTRGVHVVNTTGPDYGVHANSQAGGVLEFNVHDCPVPGIYLESCTNVEVDLTGRTSGGIGISMENCTGLHGRIYGESNQDYNIQLTGVSRSEFNYWMENAHYTATAPYDMNQGQRILCWGNTFFGQAQVASCTAWNDDEVSRQMNVDISSPQVVCADVGTLVNTDDTKPIELYPVGWNPGQIELSPDNLSVTVKAGAFDSPPAGAHYIRFVQSGSGTQLTGQSFSLGDCMVIKFKVSSPDYDYLSTDNHPTLRLAMNYSTLGQNIWINQPGTIEYVTEPIFFTSAGSDVTFITYLDVGRADHATLTGPSQDYTITFSDIEVYFIDNTP